MRSQLLRQKIMGNQVPQNLAQITTQAQPQQESKPTNLTSTQVHYEKKLISLTCNCSLERNNCPIAAMNKEKVKIISILQDKNSNFFLQIKFQNCGLEAFFCSTKQIVRCHAQNSSKGMMSFEINEDLSFQAN